MNKRIKGLSLFLVLTMLIVGLVGCGKNDKVEEVENNEEEVVETEEGKIVVEDGFGKKVEFDEPAKKIVSLAPNNTEILFALGLDEEVVGVTSFCDYPEEATEKEQIGDFQSTNLEKIIELGADLVLTYGPGNEDDVARLEESGIKVVGFEPESIEEVIETIEKIGLITGKSEEATKLAEEMNAKVEEITEKVKDADKVKVFYEIWHEPLQAAGEGSFINGLMELAGGENIAKDIEITEEDKEQGSSQEYPLFDLEQLIERDPEVYLTAGDNPDKTIESIKERPGYEDITAIKEGNVHMLDPNVISRPGPRIVEALELVAKAIHPELF